MLVLRAAMPAKRGRPRGVKPDDRGAAVGRQAGGARPGRRARASRRAGDVAVGDQQRLRQLAHASARPAPLERGEHVEARQGRGERGSRRKRRISFSIAWCSEQAKPEPQPPLGRRAPPVHAFERVPSRTSPPAIAIAWPLIACGPGAHSQSTAAATSSGRDQPALRVAARQRGARLRPRCARSSPTMLATAAAHHVGIGEARADRVHRDALCSRSPARARGSGRPRRAWRRYRRRCRRSPSGRRSRRR